MYKELEDATVHNLFDESLQKCDDEILKDLCNERDKRLIYQVPIPMRSRKDSWFWLLEEKGEFTM